LQQQHFQARTPTSALVYERLDERWPNFAIASVELPLQSRLRDLDLDLVPGGPSLHRTRGNSLVLRQVETLLAEGRAVGNKELREYMEVTGYADGGEVVLRPGLEPGEWNTVLRSTSPRRAM